MFDVAIFTDTRKNESIDGIDGFNFQAVSRGFTAADRQTVKARMLHEIALGWEVDHDPMAHPQSFVYLWHADRLYVAKGRSTGVTNNGRPGNVLTEAIVTGDPDDLGGFRPAQLFGAVNWQLEKAASRSLEAWAAPLEIQEEFQSEALRAMVLDDPWAMAELPAFLTMVEQVSDPTPKRLVIVTADPLVAQRWIALGTLFVDAERAISLSVRGMVPDPLSTKADIVAGSPEFGPQPSPTDARTGANVIDLDGKQHSPVTVTDSARTQAGWFLEEDSATALTAVDLARRWERVLGPDVATRATAASVLAGVADNRPDWVAVMTALRSLAKEGQEDELFFYGDSLVDAAVTYEFLDSADAPLAAEVFSTLLAVGSHELATGILLSSLEQLNTGRVPDAAASWFATTAASTEGLSLVCEDAETQMAIAGLLSSLPDQLGENDLPDFLSVLTVIRQPIDPQVAERTVQRSAQHWVTHPSLSERRHRWAYASAVVGRLAASLVAAWQAWDRAALDSLVRGDWDWLGTDGGARNAAGVDAWLEAARLARVPPEDRGDRVWAATKVPEEAWPLVWEGVTLPQHARVVTAWVDRFGGLGANSAGWLWTQTQHALRSQEDLAPLRELLLALAALGRRVANAELAEFAARTAQVSDTLYAFARARRTDPAGVKFLRDELAIQAPLVVEELGDALILCRAAPGMIVVANACPDWSAYALKKALQRRRQRDPSGLASAIRAALDLLNSPVGPVGDVAHQFLLTVVDSKADLASVVKGETELGDLRSQFDDFAKDARKGQVTRRFLRAGTGLFRGKDED